jgi:two-component system, sensor histidine kinase RpfC
MSAVLDRSSSKGQAHLDLLEAASRIGNDRVSQVFAAFREERAAFYRVVIMALVFTWVQLWKAIGPQPVLVADAVAVYPATVAIFAISVLWWLAIRFKLVRTGAKADAVGTVANLVFIAVLLKPAFILLITLNALLPFIAISVGARYGKRAFHGSLLSIFAILLITAPDGYWLSRPAYALYAVALTIGLPLMVGRMLNALRDATIEAVIARDAQSRFISTMSHELRTPLNSLTNCAVLIDHEQLKPDQRELMQAVTYNANALLSRVNEVLDVAGIDGGRMALVSEPFRVAQVVRTAYAVCDGQAREKGVELDVSLGSDAAVSAISDGGRIEQAITNLVSNAIKFTPTGGRVGLRVERRPDTAPGQVNLRVTVADTGIGIPEHRKKDIFKPFHQISEGASRRFGGVGLGLYIVHSISEMLDGTLVVSDNPGGGTVFTWDFALPLSEDQSSAEPDSVLEALAEHRRTHSPLKIVAFEDVASNRLVLGRMLEMAGHKVEFHDNGQDAVARVRGADLVFLDLHMPGKSGYSVMEELKLARDEGLPPCVLVTAEISQRSVQAAKDAGIYAFLSKPIVATKLLDVIERVHADKMADRTELVF